MDKAATPFMNAVPISNLERELGFLTKSIVDVGVEQSCATCLHARVCAMGFVTMSAMS